VPPERKE